MAKKINKKKKKQIMIVLAVFLGIYIIGQGGVFTGAITDPTLCGGDSACIACVNTAHICVYSTNVNVWYEREYSWANDLCGLEGGYYSGPYSTEQLCEDAIVPSTSDCTSPDGNDGDYYCSNLQFYICDINVGDWDPSGTCTSCIIEDTAGTYNEVCDQSGGVCDDDDGDGYGECPDCGISDGCTYDGDDCNDADSNINPGATEVCGNGIDDNCDGSVDEGCGSGCTFPTATLGEYQCLNSGANVNRCDPTDSMADGNGWVSDVETCDSCKTANPGTLGEVCACTGPPGNENEYLCDLGKIFQCDLLAGWGGWIEVAACGQGTWASYSTTCKWSSTTPVSTSGEVCMPLCTTWSYSCSGASISLDECGTSRGVKTSCTGTDVCKSVSGLTYYSEQTDNTILQNHFCESGACTTWSYSCSGTDISLDECGTSRGVKTSCTGTDVCKSGIGGLTYHSEETDNTVLVNYFCGSGGTTNTWTAALCLADPKCETSGLCEVSEDKKKCVKACAPWSKWVSASFDGTDPESGCELDMNIIILVGLAVIGMKMFRGGR